MLTPVLDALKKQLERKGQSRSTSEDRLLDELSELDNDPQIQNILSKKSLKSFKDTRILSSGNKCNCCGSTI